MSVSLAEFPVKEAGKQRERAGTPYMYHTTTIGKKGEKTGGVILS